MLRTQGLITWLVSLVCALLQGCSPLLRSVPENDLARSNRYTIVSGIDMPEVPGPKGCGAQALAAAMAFADPTRDASGLASELPWQESGATPVDLLLEARRRGFVATIHRGTLEWLHELAAAGRPAIVMIDAGLEVRGLLFRYPTPNVMHWAVVSGVAIDSSEFLLANEDRRHYIVSRDELLRRWERSDCCMLIITMPG